MASILRSLAGAEVALVSVFCVSIDIAKRVVPVLIGGEFFEYSWLGISDRGLIPEVAEAMNLPADTRGLVLLKVVENGPADRAGLQDRGTERSRSEGEEFPLGGDVVLAINGALLRDMDDLVATWWKRLALVMK